MYRLKYRLTQKQRDVMRNRRELIKAGISRRDLMKLGLMTSAGLLVDGLSVSKAFAQFGGGGGTGGTPISPPITPFLDLLPTPRDGTWRINPSRSLASLGPAPTVAPNTAAGEGRTIPHQALTEFPPQKYYAVTQKEDFLSITSDPNIPPQRFWGFATGLPSENQPINVPGPLYVARYGEPILVRNHNELPDINNGFGINSVTTHLHNGHTPSESDGGPCLFFPKGKWYDHHYPNVLAGVKSTHIAQGGDIREAMHTLWYHDHRVDFTSQNVYKGLFGQYLLFNNFDTGDENTGFRLPSFPQYDIPMMFNDWVIDPGTQQIFFDLFNLDGFIGDRFGVNGKVQPVLHVSPRRYRFRWTVPGPSRFYQMFLTNPASPSTVNPYWQISTDGNLLDRPVQVSTTRLGVAERVDVIVDFTGKAGQTFYIENRLVMADAAGPGRTITLTGPMQGNLLLKIVVDGPAVADNSRDPATITSFYGFPSTTDPVRVSRNFTFQNRGDWRVNGQLFECGVPRFKVLRNSVERWTLTNEGGGWHHPVHIHFEEFQTLSINGRAPATSGIVQRGRKDVARLEANDSHQVYFRFRDFTGRYPMHCHNVVHEDHAMMLEFDIVDSGADTIQNP